MANKPFSAYYAEALANLPASPQTSGSPTPKGLSFKGLTTPERPSKPFNFLDWGIDILSRPLYAVTEVADSIADSAAERPEVLQKFESGDVGGAISQIAGQVGRQVSAPARGFFSTNREDKRLTSELIEKGTDIAGAQTNPEYEDVQDNVNPWVKGIAGFAGDVALDPLTWVPGGVTLSLLKKGKEAAKAGGEIAQNLRGGGKAVEETAESAPVGGRAEARAEAEAAELDRMAAAPEPRRNIDITGEAPPRVSIDELLPEKAPTATTLTDRLADVEKATPVAKVDLPGVDDIVDAVVSMAANVKRTAAGAPKKQSVAAALRRMENADPRLKEILDVELDVDGDLFPVRSWIDDYLNGMDDDMVHLRSALDDSLSLLAGGAKQADEVPPTAVAPEPAAAAPAREVNRTAARSAFNAGMRAGRQVDGDAIRADGFGEYADAFEAGRTLSAGSTARVPKADADLAFDEWLKAGDEGAESVVDEVPQPVADVQPTAREAAEEIAAETPAQSLDDALTSSPRFEYADELVRQLGDRVPAEQTYGEFILRQAQDPKTAKTAAVQADGFGLAWKDVPAFLKKANKESRLYELVTAEVTKAWKRKGAAAKGAATKWNKLTKMERFSHIVKSEDGRALAEAALGIAVASRLASVKRPDKFDALMTEIGDVISRKLNLDEISKESIKFDTTRDMLRQFGIADEALDVEAVSPSSHVTEAVGAAERAADLSRPQDRSSATQAVIDSVTTPEGGPTLGDRAARLTAPERDAATVVTRVIGRDVFGIGLKGNEKRPYRTRRGAARTSKEAGKGFAVWEGRINGPTQHNISNSIFVELSDTLKSWRTPTGDKLNAGPQYAAKAKELYMDRAQIIHRLFDREGIAQHLGIKEDDLLLSDYQLRAVLDGVDSKLSTMLLYNLPTKVPTTNLYNAVGVMLRGGTEDEIRAALETTQTVYKQGVTETYVNPLTGDGQRYYGHRNFPKGPPEALPGTRWVKNPKAANGYFLQYDAVTLRELTMRMLQQAKPQLQDLSQKNANARKVRIEAETAELTAAERAWLEEIVTDPSKMGVAIRATAAPEATVQNMARDAGATQEAVVLASINSELDIPVPDKIVSEGAAEVADTQKASGDPTSGKQKAQATQERLLDDTDQAIAEEKIGAAQRAAQMTDDELVDAGVADEAADISRQTQIQVDISIAHAMNPNINGLQQRMGKAFKANYGFERISRFRHNAEVASAVRRSAFIDQIGRLVAKHGGVVKGATSTKGSLVLKQAWNAVRTGAPTADPIVNAARQDLESLFGTLFDVTRQESILGNVFFRNPVSVDHVNGELLAVGLRDAKGEPIQFDIGAAKAKADLNGTDTMTEMIEQWRTWDLDDPAEGVLKLFAAAERVSTKAVIGQNFNRFTAANGLYSATPKPGFAQPMASGRSIFISMLKQDGYYDAEILKELSRLEAFMSASRSFDGGIGKFIHGVFDPMQQSWKFGMTVVRPGHHVRNLVGDASMTYLAEGVRFAKKSTTDAIKVLATMYNKYDGYDYNRALEGLGLPRVPGSSDVLMSGRYGDFTIQQIYEAYYTRGLQNSYRHSEDVLDEGLAPQGFARLMNRLSLRGGKIEHAAGSVSQARDHFARMQHFLQYLYKAQKDGGRGKSLEELFDNAAHQVKKYHPDGSMLTPFESKYLRRIIPFYSWLRGAIPAMIEASALKPSRVTVFPKASYNLAVAMGINPDSLENPFPEDQLFPSFLSDQVFGPQFGNARDGYFGFSPGIATVDVANQFLAGAPVEGTLRGLAGSTSPIFRIPAELLSGGSWGTGARINDASDYIDSNLPGINYLSNVSGYSVTGSVAGMLTGQGADQQLQVDRGNKGDVDKLLSLTNYLTGASVQNMSRPNYINYAEIEKRNAAAQAGEEGRNAF